MNIALVNTVKSLFKLMKKSTFMRWSTTVFGLLHFFFHAAIFLDIEIDAFNPTFETSF